MEYKINKNKILSFDVSSVSTGWALLVDGKLQEFGIIKIDKGYSIQKKLYIFKNNVQTLLNVLNPTCIIVEDTYLKNVKTLKVLMQFIGIVNVVTFEILNIELLFVSPNTVRKEYKLKTKEEAFDYIKNKYKVKLKNYTFDTGNDISDAILQVLYCFKKCS